MKLKVIYVCANKMKKESNELQRTIVKAANELGNKIVQYFDCGVTFTNIFNAENIKYDKHGDNFFTYKAHGKNKSQLRLLYACVQSEDETFLIIVDYIEKRKSNHKGHKDHLEKFAKYDDLDFSLFCKKNNICIA